MFPARLALHLEHDEQIVRFKERKQFFEAGNGFIRKRLFSARKPGANIDLFDLGPRQVGNTSRQAGGAPQCVVVNGYWNAVASEANIKFDSVAAGRDRFSKSSHRVFRRYSRRTAMTDDQGRLH